MIYTYFLSGGARDSSPCHGVPPDGTSQAGHGGAEEAAGSIPFQHPLSPLLKVKGKGPRVKGKG